MFTLNGGTIRPSKRELDGLRDTLQGLTDAICRLKACGDTSKRERFYSDLQVLKHRQPPRSWFFKLAHKRWLKEVIACHQAFFRDLKFAVNGLQHDTNEGAVQLDQQQAVELMLRIHDAFMKVPHVEVLAEKRADEEFLYGSTIQECHDEPSKRNEQNLGAYMTTYINTLLEFLSRDFFKV